MSEAHPSTAEPSHSFWRSLQTLNASRIIVAASLLILLSLRSGKDIWTSDHLFGRDIGLLYLLVAIGFVVLKQVYPRRFMWQLTAQILLDIAIISAMYLADGGSKSGLGILYLFPLAGVAILSPLLWSFFFTSIVVLFILAESVYHYLRAEDGSPLSQVGLYGAAYFAVVTVVNRLARNLINQEQLAAQRGNALAIQQAINQLVVTDMGDGMLVLDQDGCMFEINPAATRMLGGNLNKEMIGIELASISALRPIVEILNVMQNRESKFERRKEEEISFVSIRCYLDELRPEMVELAELVADTEARERSERERPHFVTHLKLRFVTIKGVNAGDVKDRAGSYTIIFMQDVSDIENQAQQLKLASMGRLTASIAHEVRNPLSSISYAASLLNEDLHHLGQDRKQALRLLKIVDDNVARLNQLIEDILKLSRKAQSDIEPYMVMDHVADMVQDFVETKGLAGDLILVVKSKDFTVNFDPSHLREVVLNLLSNAIRYASGQPGSIRLFAYVNATGRQELHIQDDGPVIPYDVRSHLFEPFYTTSRMGTGLGLYMARELCLNNHALLDYEYRVEETDSGKSEPSGRFVINFSGYSA
ncbi:ATP-binding protein [Undibacterium sp. TS12]|uniref:sensor histidine kinase n=1 Tax=Undibacterium sp. TS12 TaxID=2908202 RepID=UPI001F4C772B|nr:ATP-binding protein [Undibacterium sp. TS12]MCH8620156.1 ATP-binding protein [Undibacterium sp. TS12]